MSEVVGYDTNNIQAELMLCGSMYKEPELYVQYGSLIHPDYDFTDESCKFFYTQFEDYYLTFSQEVTESKINTYMSQNTERFKEYKERGGWRIIRSMMELSDPDDIKNIYDTIKKYALIREYDKSGFPAEKLMRIKGFQTFTANDVYRWMRAQCDRINTNINNINEPIILTDKTVDLINGYLNEPEFGTPSCFKGFNEYFRGYLPSKVLFNGCLSNEGKSRYMTKVICDVALKQRKPCLLLSNEQTKTDFHNALVTTVVCNPEFQALHGVKISKPEKEITMGRYRSDATGKFIDIKKDDFGDDLETQEEFYQRVYNESSEYRKIRKIAEWIEAQTVDKLIYFLDISDDYSDQNLETQIRKAKLCYGCQYFFYDTMKAWQLEDWTKVKLTATNLCELAKELNIYMMCSFQMVDSAVFDDIFNLTSNTIASCKAIKTVCDMLTLCKRLNPEEYDKYKYIPFGSGVHWFAGEPIALDKEKKYFAQVIDKNRLYMRGAVLLYEYSLNENTWDNIGLLVQNDAYTPKKK